MSYLLSLLSISVLYRLIPTLLSPSVIGVDPYWYAVQSAEVTQQGTVDVIQSPFYRGAPGYITYLSFLTEILGVEPEKSGIVIAVIMAVLLPLVGSLTVLHITTGKLSPSLNASAIIVITPPSIHYALWPIAQSLAMVLFAVFILSLLHIVTPQQHSPLKRESILVIPIICSLALIHKFPILIGVLVLILLYYSRGLSTFKGHSLSSEIVLFTGVILLTVWTFNTNFIANIILMFKDLITEGFVVYSTPPEPTAATQKKVGPWYIIGRNLHWFTLVSVGGISLIILFYHRITQRATELVDSKITVIIICSALLIFLIILGTIGSSSVFNPKRTILISSFILPVLICGSLVHMGDRKHLTILLLIFIIMTQGVAFGLLPDDSNAPRSYLTESEIEGRQFVSERTQGPIYTDTYYTKTVTNTINPESGYKYSNRGKYRSYDDAVFDGSFSPYNPDQVAYRTNIDLYGHLPFGGFWELDWNPDRKLNDCGEKVYSNPHVSMYITSECWD